MDTLLEVRKDVQAKKEALESSLHAAERDFSRRLNELNAGFEVRSQQTLPCATPDSSAGRQQILWEHGGQNWASWKQRNQNRYTAILALWR